MSFSEHKQNDVETLDNSFDQYLEQNNNSIKFNSLNKHDQNYIQEFFNGTDFSIVSVNELINELCFDADSQDKECEVTINYLERIIRELKNLPN
jgi:hypothetical protein